MIVEPFHFAHHTDNLSGTPSATPGTNFTANANNADGTAVSVLSALAHDVHNLVIAFAGISVSTANSKALADILVDPAGGTSWSALINDLVCGFTPIPAGGANSFGQWFYFPIFIKAGTSVGVRARTAHSANLANGRVIMVAQGNPSRPEAWWCGQGVESLGINAAASAGTDVVPGNTNAFGAWKDIGSTSTRHFGAVQWGVNGSDASSLAVNYAFELGIGSNRLPGSQTIHIATATTEVSAKNGCCPIPCDIRSGTQFQVRGKCSGTAENYDAAVYGVY